MRIALLIAALLSSSMSLAGEVSFKEQLAPILARRCLGCHDNRKTEGRYAVHTFEQLLKPGDSGERPIVPGKPDESYLLQKLTDRDESVRMPQEDDTLSAAEIGLFRDWIAAGAKFDGPAAADRIVTLLPARQHPKPPETYRVATPVFALQFTPDGQSLLSAGVNEVLVWSASSGKLERRLAGMPQRIHALRFSPDGKTLAVAGGAPGEYGEIRLVAWPGGEVRTLPAWEDVVIAVAFDPEGQRLVAGGADNSVRGYDLIAGKQLWRTQQHVDWVTALDVSDYQFVEEMSPNPADPGVFTFNQDEQTSGSHVRQDWRFVDGRYIVREANWELEVAGDKIVGLTKITITGIGKTYKETREPVAGNLGQDQAAVVAVLKKLHNEWGQHAAATRFVFSTSRDRTVKVCALNSGTLFTTYKGHRREYGPLAGLHRVFGVTIEPGTRRVWSGGEGRHFHGWNPITVRDEDGTAADMEARFAKEYSMDCLRHDFAEAVFALARSGSQVVAATAGGAVKRFTISGPQAVYSIPNPAPSQAFIGQQDQLYAVAAHLESDRIAAAGFTGEVVVWQNGSEQPALRFVASPLAAPPQTAAQP